MSDLDYYLYLRTLEVPREPQPPATLVRASLGAFADQLRLVRATRGWVLLAWLQPLICLAVFAPPLSSVGPHTCAWHEFAPGLVLQLGVFGCLFAALSIVAERRQGSLACAATSRLAVLLGRVLLDTLVLLLQAAQLTLVAVAYGLHVPLGDALLTAGVVGALGVALAAVSHAAARRIPRGVASPT